MAESKMEDASTTKTQKKGSMSDEFGKEFLSSWKSMSVSEGDGLDFGKEAAPKGKKSAFNFDKLDMDFSLDGDFGKNMSSFKVDMSELDFSSPPKKLSKPKEKSAEESPGGKHAGKQSRFSFDFDFNELDSFDFGSSLLKGKDKSDRAADLKGVESPGKQENVQTARSKPAISIDLPEDSNTEKMPTSQSVSSLKLEHLIGGMGKFNPINPSPSTSANFGNSSASRSTEAYTEKEIIVSAKETDQCSQQSDKTISTEPNNQKYIQDSPIRSVSMEGSVKETGADTQGEVCSSATEEKTYPEEAQDTIIRLRNPESSPAKNIPVPKNTTNECDMMLENRGDVRMGDTPSDESIQGDKSINDSSDGNPEQKMLHRTEKENNVKSKLLAPLQSEPKIHQPAKEKGSGGIQSKYFNRSVEMESLLSTQSILKKNQAAINRKADTVLLSSADGRSEPKNQQSLKGKGTGSIQSKYFNKSIETESQLISQSTPKKICSVSNKKTENVILSPSDPRRQQGTVGNHKIDNAKPHEPATAEGPPIMLGNRRTEETRVISAGFQIQSTRLPEQAVKSPTPKSLNSKLVSSIAAIRISKSAYVEENKISPLPTAKKTLEATSLKVSRLVTANDASHSKALTEVKSLRRSDKSTSIHCASTKIIQTPSVEKNGLLSPPIKRKMYEEPNANPLTHVTSSPIEYRGSQETSEISRRKRIRTTENLPNSFHSTSPTLYVPRDKYYKELDVSSLMENDGNVEKAEAYSKELEDICSMLKKKHEEAKELLVRAIVNNNELLMLNHPIYDEKIRMVQRFAALMLSPAHQRGSGDTTIQT